MWENLIPWRGLQGIANHRLSRKKIRCTFPLRETLIPQRFFFVELGIESIKEEIFKQSFKVKTFCKGLFLLFEVFWHFLKFVSMVPTLGKLLENYIIFKFQILKQILVSLQCECFICFYMSSDMQVFSRIPQFFLNLSLLHSLPVTVKWFNILRYW